MHTPTDNPTSNSKHQLKIAELEKRVAELEKELERLRREYDNLAGWVAQQIYYEVD